MYALVDCNNFFVSCEKLFKPKYEGRPVIVLSNNDGCVISRSNEAKVLGIPMGIPFFKCKKLCEERNVIVLSSNFQLYGDMSNRVMAILRELVPEVEIYSIDEAFLRLDNFPKDNLMEYLKEVQKKIKKWTGIPASIGLAPTKTLAKIANFVAKKNNIEVFDLRDAVIRDKIFPKIEVENIWGIGRKTAIRLKMQGINFATQLRDADPKFIRKMLSVVGERLVLELRGIPCYKLNDSPEPRKNIVVSRSFGRLVTCINDLEEAVSHYGARACEKMRAQYSAARGVYVYIMTSRHKKNKLYYQAGEAIWFPEPTSNTMLIVKRAKECLKAIFKSGYHYYKAGVYLLHLTEEEQKQGHLINGFNIDKKSSILMKTIDDINKNIGKDAIFLAGEGIRKPWLMKSMFRSPGFTTNWNELIQAD